MPHWHEKHSLRALRNMIAKAQKTESRSERPLDDALKLVDELLTRRRATRLFNRNAAGAMKEIKSTVTREPKHYTSRQLVSKFKERFGREKVLAAIDNLQEKGSITFVRQGRGKGKGRYVALPPSRKAA